MPESGQIDAIKVGLGIDKTQLRADLSEVQGEFRSKIPTQRTVNVHIKTFLDQNSIKSAYDSAAASFANIHKQNQGTNSPRSLRIAPRMIVDPRVMITFRRDIERNMAQAGRQGHALHVPIKFNGDVRGFIQSVEMALAGHAVKVKVEGDWGGGGPASGGGGTPSTPPAGGPAGSGPATARPARGRASTATAAPTTAATAAQPPPRTSRSTAPRGRGTEASSSDRYEVPPDEPVGATPPLLTARQERQRQQRRNRMAQAAPTTTQGGPRRPTNTYGPGNRNTVGANVNPNYVEPPGGRVTVGNVREGSAPVELQGEERAQYARQQGARPTSGQGQMRQPGERILSATERVNNDTLRRTLETRAQRIRQEQAQVRAASPGDQAAKAVIASGFHEMDPNLAAVYDTLADPTYKGSLQDLLAATELGREAYGTAFHGQTTKSIRKQIGIIRGTKKGDINEVDPSLLLHVSALEASREFIRGAADPMYHVKPGDPSSAIHGKVGPMHGRSAGSSKQRQTVDPAAVDEIIRRRGVGGKGHGWKTLQDEYGPAEVARARSIIGERKERAPSETEAQHPEFAGVRLDEERTEGGTRYRTFTHVGEREPVLKAQGGQGMAGRPEPKPRQYATREQFAAAGDISRAGGRRTAAPPLRETGAPRRAGDGPAPLPPGTPVPGGQARTSRPPRPESRAYGRNQEYASRPGQGGFGGSEQFFEFLRGFRGAAPGARPQAPGGRTGRIERLKAMATQTQQSPYEADEARRRLRNMGIPGFAEGGLRPQYGKYLDIDLSASSIPGRYLRGLFGFSGPMPRPGTKARGELEDRAREGIRNRRKYENKPLYQRGGKSDPEWEKARGQVIAQNMGEGLRCAVCGQPTTPGDKGPLGTTVDHILDTASGGSHNLDNLQILCNRHNGLKSGGRSARPINIGAFAEGGKTGPVARARSMHQQYLRGYRVPEGAALYKSRLRHKGQVPKKYGLWASQRQSNDDPWGHDRSEFEEDLGALRRVQGYAEGGIKARMRNARLYRGGGPDQGEKPFIQMESDSGLFGRGAYSTTDRAYAQRYSEDAAWGPPVVHEGDLPVSEIFRPRGRHAARLATHLAENDPRLLERLTADRLTRLGADPPRKRVRYGGAAIGIGPRSGSVIDPGTFLEQFINDDENRLRGALTGAGYSAVKFPIGKTNEIVSFRPERIQKRAEGGYVKHGGLLQRVMAAGHRPKGMPEDFDITMIGERGPELNVHDRRTGETEVIPTHRVPMWLSRMQQGKLPAKDMTHHQEGGLRMRGPAGPRPATASRAASGILAGGDITRVFVVNWPALLTSAQEFAKAQGAANERAAKSEPKETARARAPETRADQEAGVGGPGPASGTNPGMSPPGAGRVSGAGTINPLTRVRARDFSRQGELQPGSFEDRIQTVRAGITESLQQTPVRALSVAFGQIAQTAIGGRAQILGRARAAQVAAGRAQRAEGDLDALRQAQFERTARIGNIRAGRETFDTTADRDATLATLRAQRRTGFQAIQAQRGVVEQRVGKAETLEANVLTRGQQFKSQAVGLGGIIAGTTLFSAAITATAAAGTAAAAALDPLLQALIGFPAAIDRVTVSIRDAVQASGGFTAAGAARALAPSGVSQEFLDRQGGAAIQTGTNRAAQMAAEQALDITRANAGLGGRQRGLYEGVGGLFGTNIGTEVFGGQPGFLQSVERRLQVNAPGGEQNVNPSFRAAIQSNPFTGAAFGLAGGFENPPGDVEKQKAVVDDLNASLGRAAQSGNDAAGGFKLVLNATEEQRAAMIASAATISQEAKTRAEAIARTGVAVVGPNERLLQGGQFQQYAEQQVMGAQLQDPRLLLAATAPQRRAQAFQIEQQGRFGREEDIPAAFAFRRIAAPPQRFGTTFQPTGPLAQAQTRGLAGSEAGQKTLSNIETYTKLTTAAQQANLTADKRGMVALEKIVSRIDRPTLAGGAATFSPSMPASGQAGGGGTALSRFRQLTGEIGSLGQSITTITEGINLRSTNLQVREYSNTIRVTARSLADAEDMWAAINGNVRKTLGGMQGQNMILDRQNQLLGRRAQQLSFKSEDLGFRQAEIGFRSQERGFNQTQRQINFSVATAGFQAPGASSEERSARIAEAKIEAQFAQENLNDQRAIAELAKQQLAIAKEQQGISKQQFGNTTQQQDNAYAIQIEEAKRAVTDLTEQLGIVEEQRAIAIDSAAAEETITRLREQQGLLIEEAQSYVEEGNSIRSQLLSDTTNLMAQTNAAVGTLITGVQQAWTTAFDGIRSGNEDIAKWLSAMPGQPQHGGASPSERGEIRNGRPGSQHRDLEAVRASGGIDYVDKPTRFMAGDAGGEHVIVLRNPSQGMLLPSGSGGGGGMVFSPTINMPGLTVRNDNDVATIKAIVEETLNRTASQLLRVG